MLKPAILTTAILIAGILSAKEGRTADTLTRVEIDTQVTIAASADAIWTILTDFGRYPDWNPYHVRVEGRAAPGAKLIVHIEKPNGTSLSVRPRVMQIVPRRSLVWGGGLRGVFHGEHRFDLTPLGPTCTRLSHSEVFSGLFVRAAALDAIEPGYRQMNAALKARAEKGAGSKADQACETTS